MARNPQRRDGCGFLLLTAVFAAIFLVINGGLFSILYGQLMLVGPTILANPKMAQF